MTPALPVDRQTLREVRNFLLLIEWDWPNAEPHRLLLRLPDPDAAT